ncbi:MAG: 23S rRNA (uridine(2552)-2'-O)-methyltransferase RlmE [Thiotrichales bacterium]|jgi:23S rRNA (uridine2552-2'-O)-methyltransferase|nr:23S rRNA (uridine(2552)-2'-O)-methyltransferase RlmE [Thiotrichales bacterium]
MARTKSSQTWLKEHFSDPFWLLAQKEGYRSRATYKLKELDEKERLLKPGMLVADLGAAPGGWSQWAAERVSPGGMVVGLDLLPIVPLDGAVFLQGDFREESVLQLLLETLDNRQVDIILSDMAPNTSGIRGVDVPRSIYLSELALEFAALVLKPGGDLLIKVFQGQGFDALLKDVRNVFTKVQLKKPKASRDRSVEVYVLARGYRGNKS